MPRRRLPAGVRACGFTLIEMVVVVLIVGILASAAFPLAQMSRRREQEAELRLALRTIRDAIDAYKAACATNQIDCGGHADGPGSYYPPDLQALVHGALSTAAPTGASGSQPRIYFLRRLPRDPFARPDLPAEQTWGLRSYESDPENPEAGNDVYDVFSLSAGVGLNGQPYRQW